MQAVVEIKFEELVKIVKTLTPAKLTILKSELEKDTKSIDRKYFKDLLLNGPTFSTNQLKQIDENRKDINKWRTI
jgi:hypothetical protein